MTASLPLAGARTLADVARAGGLARAAAWLDGHAHEAGELHWFPTRNVPALPGALIRTPGVRAPWSNLAEWLNVWRHVVTRPPTSAKYSKMAAHLVTLAEHPEVVMRAPAALRVELAQVVRQQTPPHGMRVGHPTTHLKDALDRAAHR